VHNDQQRRLAEASRSQIERERGGTVHTKIVAYGGFTQAEDYHQKHSLRQFPAFEKELARVYPTFADFVASTAVARVNGYLGGEGSYEALRNEADGLGLSAERKEELLRLVQRQRSKAACPLPERGAGAGAH
jgi:peptide-methionine (S)-S-oxide reductase